MRKVWSRIFLLCMACMICMSGLCLAKEEEKENWVQYYYKDSNNIFYVDTNSIKVREYEGRKYLDVKVRAKGEQEEWYYIVTRTVEVTYAKWHKVFDIENRKVLNLEWDNKYSTPKKGTRDISELGERGWDLHKYLFDEQLVSWVEQNYPSVINEIRTHNQSIPGAKTDVMGTTGGSSGGSLQDIVGDIEYEVLDSGAVKFSPRCMAPVGDFVLYQDTYYICAKPEKYNAYPGAYIIGTMDDDGTIHIGGDVEQGGVFDYDSKTQTFSFYSWPSLDNDPIFAAPENSVYGPRMRLIDKNTVYREEFGYYTIKEGLRGKPETDTYRYIPYNQIPLQIISVGPYGIEVQEHKNVAHFFDSNKCLWFGSRWFGDDRLNAAVDMMRAFLAVNGNVGPAPGEVEHY